MHTYIGNETFLVNGSKESITINDFWRWAYSDFTNNINRSVLAEFIVASSLDIIQTDCESFRDPWRPFDLLYDMKYRVEVKAAGYVQSHSAKHPDHISFSIAPARIPTETGEYKPEATLQRNCDIYIFCVYTAMSVSADQDHRQRKAEAENNYFAIITNIGSDQMHIHRIKRNY